MSQAAPARRQQTAARRADAVVAGPGSAPTPRLRSAAVKALSPLFAAAAIALAGSLCGLGLAAARGTLQLEAKPRPEVCSGPGAPHVVVARIQPQDAARLCGEGKVLIADARPPADFARGHVVGAVHLPCTASGEAAVAALGALPGYSALLVYGNTTEEAVQVAETLAARNTAVQRVLALEGGFDAWEKAGLACASGPCDQCALPGQAVQP
jgi:rhodanese-related sulfurtransferase